MTAKEFVQKEINPRADEDYDLCFTGDRLFKLLDDFRNYHTVDDEENARAQNQRMRDWFSSITGLEDELLFVHMKRIEHLLSLGKSEECEHPFKWVISKCNSELNKCLKCGKTF